MINHRLSLKKSIKNANARAVGTIESDAIRNLKGEFNGLYSNVQSALITFRKLVNANRITNDANNFGTYTFDASKVVPTGAENRPVNTAFNPRIVAL